MKPRFPTGSPPKNGEGPNQWQLAGPSGDSKAVCEANDTSTSAQCNRLLAALARGPVTTLAARRDLSVMHPAMRVLELRRAGYDIVTRWNYERDDAGVTHRQGLYVLNAGGCHACAES